MFDTEKYFKEENSKTDKVYREKIAELEKIKKALEKPDRLEIEEYVYSLTKKVLEIAEIESRVKPGYFEKNTFQVLEEDNRKVYFHRLASEYRGGFEDLEHCAEKFGEEKGKLLSFFCNQVYKNLRFCFSNRRFFMVRYLEKIIKIWEAARTGEDSTEKLREIILSDMKNLQTDEVRQIFKEQFDPEFSLFKEVIGNSDLSDPKYIFSYGRYVSDNEKRMAKFLSSYPDDKLKELGDKIYDAYIRGFKISGKTWEGKPYVLLLGSIGQEAILRYLQKRLIAENFEVLYMGMSSTTINEQTNYDFKFSDSLYLDEEYTNSIIESTGMIMEEFKDTLSKVSGLINVAKFGEVPFVPEIKSVRYQPSDTQKNLDKRLKSETMQIREKYLPMSAISFTIIAFPSPEIGDNFEGIFSDTIEINLLDNEKYGLIQKRIIDVLDRGDYVQVKGKGENRTDIKVALKSIENPEKQTKFVNCLADLNIPLGEVFTSPVLNGTQGILHVKEVFLNSLKFVDLELVFENGFVVSYNCSNFEEPEENKKYIKENLLFPHETLPMGEFAIGTNTLAYVSAKKWGITHLLPVLIIEKMGPHFAVGDTCFAFQEDMKIYNDFDGKEMVARDNERTLLRNEDVNKAYFFIHTDISLPYDEIAFIKAVSSNSEEYIIKDGEFTVKGTEELNLVFDKS
ncbi:aminopeptidase [candidate division WOR-3 bacterium]|nr:aminopeptidase [candidate division WOR-3 bacterium]